MVERVHEHYGRRNIKQESTDSDDDYKEDNGQDVNMSKEGKDKVENRTCRCRYCFKIFITRKELKMHDKMCRSEDEVDQYCYKFDKERCIYLCSACSSEYQTQEEVEEHLSKAHGELYVCKVCNYASRKAFTFAVHMNDHSKEDVYSCHLCDYTTPFKYALLSHINRIHLRKFYYNCETCGRGFNDLNIFKEHNNEHLGIKPIICVVCKKEFAYSKNMRAHQRKYHSVHIMGVPYKAKCPKCPKAFTKPATLEKHMSNYHSNDGTGKPKKPHLCDICGKAFRASDKLRTHYRIHTGEKPYECKNCEKKFAKKDYLLAHERTHTGEKPFHCEHCGKSFSQMGALKNHIKNHTGDKPFECSFCRKTYTCKSFLTQHLKSCKGRKVK